MRSSIRIWLGTMAVLLPGVMMVSACHSYHIETTVKNETGSSITLLEVDYPSASFGADTLDANGTYHHRIQTRDSGPMKVQYTGPTGKQVQITGPTLYEGQEGRIEINLLPNGKVEFHPSLNPAH